MSGKTFCFDNPPVPSGYEYAEGHWDDGFIVRRITDKSELVWIPALSLEHDGALDAKNDNEPFGYRNYYDNCILTGKMDSGLEAQHESVQKYGGFYISLYSISLSKSRKTQSVKGAMPWTHINLRDATKEAEHFECGETMASHLPYVAEVDTVLAWMLKLKEITRDDITKANTARGSASAHREVHPTGANNASRLSGLWDILGNTDEWIHESQDIALTRCYDCIYPETSNCYYRPYSCYAFCGFRAAICIKTY